MIAARRQPAVEASVRIPVDSRLALEGLLGVPVTAAGVVVFAHGSGSSRSSPRNAHVAQVLRNAGMATLLFDLLTDIEATDRINVFDVELLGQRLRDATVWVRQHEGTKELPVAYFGASTGAAATLLAAATDASIQAIVSRGGRPDLAAAALGRVKAPTLLVVGGEDALVRRLNEQAYEQLRCEKQLCVVPDAGHLFEEPGALEEVTRLAAEWFTRHWPRRLGG